MVEYWTVVQLPVWLRPQKVMSALLPKADICSAPANVLYGPIADLSSLLDNLVGAADQ
jgi:hypothetical protein